MFIRALHVPRNVSSFRFKLDTLKPFVADIVPEDDGGLLGGWTLSERDSEGYQVAEGAEPVAFGNFGLLFEINLSDIIEKNVAIPVVFDNSIYTAGQSLQHPAELYIGERIVGSGNIAFRSNRSGDFDVYAMKFDGTDQTNITEGLSEDFVPAWSPGGAQIAFGSDRIGLRQIYVMNADGSEVERLTGLASTNSLPAWSPDGQQIAFTSDRDGNRNVYVMNANGSRETQLTSHPEHDWWPAWSPDGTRIAFTSLRDGDVEVADAEVYVIYITTERAGELVNLTNNMANDYRPVWSPDSQRIAFYSTRDGNREVYVMNADGTGQKNLTNNPAEDWYPVWSPDGQKIAFTSARDGNQEIYTMDTDGGRQRNVSENPARDTAPSWGP